MQGLVVLIFSKNIKSNRNSEKVMKSLIEFKNISKSFPGVQALKDVSISVKKNSIHALVGENGAGKTTFIKICGGIETKDSGDILRER